MGFSRGVTVFRWIWANTDSISKWVQVVALVLAGYWSYTHFFKVEAPSLATVAHVELASIDFNPDDIGCQLHIGVVIQNDGRTSFDVGRTQVLGWRSQVPRATAENPAYLNIDEMRKGERVLSADSVPDSYLNKNYPPGSSYDQDFVWEFKSLDGLYLFEITSIDRNDKLLNSVRNWGLRNCGH